MTLANVIVSGSFDDLRSRHVRFLDEASKLGAVRALLWSDGMVERVTGRAPKFPLIERRYFMASIRYVSHVDVLADSCQMDELPGNTGGKGVIWAVDSRDGSSARREACRRLGMEYRVIPEAHLAGFPPLQSASEPTPGRKKVLVTGCYDWLHTGHVRFFEEVSEYGDVYAVVGHDANIELLKGAGHPQFKQDERCYMVQALRYVKQGLISTGSGWLDAEPEIEKLRPDIYAVNEDGDKGEKRDYCAANGIEYLVLKRLPKEGLPRRQSTTLRGF
jgi:cytidyltransferase-like protein